jgi:glycosyltransferase involved in cell wall biosynthesis
MKDKNPTVSVIMPTYNREEYVENSVESVLRQTYTDFEMIIIDDGSEDNTERVIKDIDDPRIIYEKNEKNLGIQKTLNKGIDIARGEYIARIDDQDTWIDKKKLDKQVNFLENNTDHVLVGTGAVVKSDRNNEIFRYLKPHKDQEIRSKILQKNAFVHVSVVFSKRAAKSVGKYGEASEVEHVEDYDLWLKLGTIGKLHNIPDYCVVYVENEKGISKKNKLEQIRKNHYLIKKFKDDYPNYWKALIRYYIRLIVYGYLNLRFMNRITAFISSIKYK